MELRDAANKTLENGEVWELKLNRRILSVYKVKDSNEVFVGSNCKPCLVSYNPVSKQSETIINEVYSIFFLKASRDELTLFAGTSFQTVYQICLKRKTKVRKIQLRKWGILSLEAYSPKNGLFIVNSRNQLIFYDRPRRANIILASKGLSTFKHSSTLSKDGRTLYLTSKSSNIWSYSVAKQKFRILLLKCGHPSNIRCIHHRSSSLFTLVGRNRILALNLQTQTIISTRHIHSSDIRDQHSLGIVSRPSNISSLVSLSRNKLLVIFYTGTILVLNNRRPFAKLRVFRNNHLVTRSILSQDLLFLIDVSGHLHVYLTPSI